MSQEKSQFDIIVQEFEKIKDNQEPDVDLIKVYSESEYARNVLGKRYYKLIASLTLKNYNRNRWLDLDDLHTEAIEGFNSAIRNYNVELTNGAKFSTYVHRCINGYILNKIKDESKLRNSETVHFEDCVTGTDDLTVAETIASDCDVFGETTSIEHLKILNQLIEGLNEKLKYVLLEYYQKDRTLDSIATELDCSKEYVRQLRNKAQKQIKDRYSKEYGVNNLSNLVTESGELLV